MCFKFSLNPVITLTTETGVRSVVTLRNRKFSQKFFVMKIVGRLFYRVLQPVASVEYFVRFRIPISIGWPKRGIEPGKIFQDLHVFIRCFPNAWFHWKIVPITMRKRYRRIGLWLNWRMEIVFRLEQAMGRWWLINRNWNALEYHCYISPSLFKTLCNLATFLQDKR